MRKGSRSAESTCNRLRMAENHDFACLRSIFHDAKHRSHDEITDRVTGESRGSHRGVTGSHGKPHPYFVPFSYVSLPIETSVFSASNTPAHSLIATNRKTSAIHDFALDIFPISKYYWHTQHIFLVKTTHAHPFHAVVYSAGAFYQNTFDTIILMPRNRNHSSCMLALKSDVVE